MEPIEDFIKNNKEEFEYIQADQRTWANIQDGLKDTKAKRFSMKSWLKVAAIIGIGLMMLTHLFTPKTELQNQVVGLEEEMLFPDLSLRNPDGESVAISELKGKVVLVEFWASYCMMCTHEHCYYFKPLYDTYKDKGFEIYSVSADSSATNWVHAIEKDTLNWIHVSDLMGNDSPVIQKYDVNGLPTNYLLDQDGKIVARNIEVEKLEETLTALLAYQ